MKRAFIVAMALSLLTPAMSMAQSDQPGRPEGNGPPNRGAPAPSRPANQAPANQAPARPQPQPAAPRPGGPGNGSGQPQRPPAPRPQPQRPQPARPQPARPQPARPQPPRPMPPSQGTNFRPLPPRGNQFWHRGQYYSRIRGPAFVYPPGWGYRQWTIGARLPLLFLAPAYFYAGWAALGLQAAPPGYAWVRYGPDLLEVNLDTGEVDDAVYGVFL